MPEDIEQAFKRIDAIISRTRLLGIQTNMIWLQRALVDSWTLLGRIKPDEVRGRYQTCLRSSILEAERLIERLEQVSDQNIRLQLEADDWKCEARRLGGPGFWCKLKHWFLHG